jgi:hypothetical protein
MEQRTKTYLLTGGLVPLFKNRYGISLASSTEVKIRIMEREYFNEMKAILENREDRDDGGLFLWNLTFADDLTIDSDFRKLITQNRSQRPLVTLDDVYCSDLADAHYSITRLVDPANLDLESVPGPRLGFSHLDEQVKILRERLGPEIDIMDIGTFGGGTISDEILGRLRNNDLSVANVFLVFAGQEGIRRINATGSNLRYLKTYNWVDWLEMRDCIGFDGRKVAHPVSSAVTQNIFIRYCDRSANWASIPEPFKEKFTQLYESYFDKIRRVLFSDAGVDVKLNKSPTHPLVYELAVLRR